MVKLGDYCLVRSLAVPFDAWTKSDLAHREPAIGAFFEDAVGLVRIVIDSEPRAAREVDEEKHVAG